MNKRGRVYLDRETANRKSNLKDIAVELGESEEKNRGNNSSIQQDATKCDQKTRKNKRLSKSIKIKTLDKISGCFLYMHIFDKQT